MVRRSLAATVALVALVSGRPAVGTTTATTDPSALLAALAPPQHTLLGARLSFVNVPPYGAPVAVSDTDRPGFPAAGPYVVLSTGDATAADRANTAPHTSADNGGGPARDGAERDVVVVRVDFVTPVPNCVVSFSYQFLSEEYPEFVDAEWADTFVAELDLSTWSAVGGRVTAPHAFVFESVDRTTMTHVTSAGSTYDGARPVPGTAAVVAASSGPHSLYLSLFDLGDNLYDTAVYVDNLVFC